MGCSRNLQIVLDKLFGEADIYHILDNGSSMFVDKISRVANKITKVRYVVQPAGWTCTCQGFVHRKTCKHIEMCNGTFEEKGAPTPSVIAFLEELQKELGSGELPNMDVNNLPPSSNCITIGLTNVGVSERILVCKAFGSGDACAFVFNRKKAI